MRDYNSVVKGVSPMILVLTYDGKDAGRIKAALATREAPSGGYPAYATVAIWGGPLAEVVPHRASGRAGFGRYASAIIHALECGWAEWDGERPELLQQVQNLHGEGYDAISAWLTSLGYTVYVG